jgi:hypothetical protein
MVLFQPETRPKDVSEKPAIVRERDFTSSDSLVQFHILVKAIRASHLL